MELPAYTNRGLFTCEKRARTGRVLAHLAQESDHRKRKQGKALRVVAFPQNGEHVPSVRVAGKWLQKFGFETGDEVILCARQGKIFITKVVGKNKDGSRATREV